MRYVLLLCLLVGCGVKSAEVSSVAESPKEIERHKNLVEQLNKISNSTYNVGEKIKTEIKENTDLLKEVKKITEKIQESLEEKPVFVEVDPEDIERDLLTESVIKNSVVLQFHTATDFNCGWCNVWENSHMPYINCTVKKIEEHSSVGRKLKKGYPYFDLVVNGRNVYSWVGSVSHQKMNSVIDNYLNSASSDATPRLKWSIGSAKNQWNPTKDEVISHLLKSHGYSKELLKGKSFSELIKIHNDTHDGILR